MKLLEENIEGMFSVINCSNIFSGQSPKTKEIKIKKKKKQMGLNKHKSFCTAKENINKTKRQPMEWEKTFANATTDKGLISKICGQLIQLNIKKKEKGKRTNPIKKWAEDLFINRHLS